MCGIGGHFGFKSRSNPDLFISALTHRGPDAAGKALFEKGYLVHTRLSIIDLSTSGTQPLYNEDKSLALVCNGEIYNYKLLTQQLKRTGHIFGSSSDSEVILHLYEEADGNIEKVLAQLTGMFAFALYDTHRQLLYVCRDRIGIKPVFYSTSNGFAFASEVASLVRGKIVTDTSIDITSVFELYSHRYIPAPNTIYNAIKSLDPGHFISFNAVSYDLHIKQYWDLPVGNFRNVSNLQLDEELDSMLNSIVSDHLVSDAPVGTFLSSGIDSSIISYYTHKNADTIKAFTASFPGAEEDEAAAAADIARLIDIKHYRNEIRSDYFEEFDHYFKNIDQPFSIVSALPLAQIANMAKQAGIKVVLTGDGADEIFAGYGRYVDFFKPKWLKALPLSLQTPALDFLSDRLKIKGVEDYRSYHQLHDVIKHFARRDYVTPEIAGSFFSTDVAKQIDKERYIRTQAAIYKKTEGLDTVYRLQHLETFTSLQDEMLVKADRMTMCVGVEARVPFLDHRLIEFAFTIPTKQKIQDGFGKAPLRRLVAKHISPQVAYKVKKGFDTPINYMIKNDTRSKEYIYQEIQTLKRTSFLNFEVLLQYAQSSTDQARPLYTSLCLANFLTHAGY